MVLRLLVEPMPAQPAEAVPGPAALRAGVAYWQKLDGHRAPARGAGAGPLAGPGGRCRGPVRHGRSWWRPADGVGECRASGPGCDGARPVLR